MPEFSLVPVDHQPDFADISLIPVAHDPFVFDDAGRRPQIEQAQTEVEPTQPQLESPSQQPPARDAPSDIGQPFAGEVGGHANMQSADFLIPDSDPTVPYYEQDATGAEAARDFARVFDGHQAAGYPAIGDASFGAVAQSNIGIIAVGPNSITSTRGVTAYDGRRQMYFEPANSEASITVSIDPTTRNISVVQNPGRRA